MRRITGLLPVLLFSVLLLACGAGDERPAAAPPADTTRIVVEVTGAGPAAQLIELRCGGAEPCERSSIEKLAALAEPDDPATACTQQYGGPEQAQMTGTLAGEPVDVTFARSDGCAIADYEALFAALGRKPPLAR